MVKPCIGRPGHVHLPARGALRKIRAGKLVEAQALAVHLNAEELNEAMCQEVERGYLVEAILLALCADNYDHAERILLDWTPWSDATSVIIEPRQLDEIRERWSETFPRNRFTKKLNDLIAKCLCHPDTPQRKAVVAILQGRIADAVNDLEEVSARSIRAAISYQIDRDNYTLAAWLALCSRQREAYRQIRAADSDLDGALLALKGVWRRASRLC